MRNLKHPRNVRIFEGMRNILAILFAMGLILAVWSCRKDPVYAPEPVDGPTPYTVELPAFFPTMPIPANNPFTVEGIDLGRHLFYDTRLSGDNTQACASCHMQEFGFSDTAQGSVGITGAVGNRQAMALINLAWSGKFFWDGRAASLEEQVLQPVINPDEMNTTWPEVITKLQADSYYIQAFEDAFGETGIDSVKIAKAMAQFLRTLVSGNSKFDKYLRFETTLTVDELEGFQIFTDFNRGDCTHCHIFEPPMFTDHSFRNNGLQDYPVMDLGRFDITGNPADSMKMKVPTLRNIEVTAPYMHTGEFNTLDEVLDFYVNNVHWSTTTDPVLYFDDMGGGTLGIDIDATEMAQVKAFLLTLTDQDFLTNPAFSDPW